MKTVAAIVLLACAAQAVAQSREDNRIRPGSRQPQAVDQIIVKWRGEDPAKIMLGVPATVQKLSSATGVSLQRKIRITGDTEVLELDRPLAQRELAPILRQLAADPAVEYAVADERRWAHAVPADPLYPKVVDVEGQWYFRSDQLSSTRAEQAWDITVGNGTTVVAVLDSGVRFEHPDLGRAAAGGKLLNGYDFVSDGRVANDGDGDNRDSDASDPGDWVAASDQAQPFFANCDVGPSSWHGTRVSSLIAAMSNNATGIAGSDWNALVLPVRVLGKCGGTDSDIIAGMRWAAGLPVAGAPANATPAKIINLSLGGTGICSPAYQSAINEIVSRGTVVVVSAGNDAGPVSSPANCAGVIAVTGLRHAGTKVGFSNLGLEAAIGAPGGNCVNTAPGARCQFSITAATNTGSTTPVASSYTTQFDINVGTSFSAPLVAGAAALMHSVNPQLSPAQYRLILRDSAAPFPTTSPNTSTVCHVPANFADTQGEECICTTQTCGAGMLNTHAAVLATQRPFASAQAPSSITAGTNIIIDGSASFAAQNRTITTYQWSALNVAGATPVFANASQAQTTLQVSGDSQFTLRLTVTDDAGGQDTADIAVATPPAPPPPSTTPPSAPPPPGGGGGGGGDMGLLVLALGVLALVRWRPTSVQRAS